MNKDKKNVCIGLLAHVDAGKTTLSEALLYQAGVLKNPGRVDKGDAYLDIFAMEKESRPERTESGRLKMVCSRYLVYGGGEKG